jgi:hypothetical protein
VCESRALLCRSGGLANRSCAEAEERYSHNGAAAVRADATLESDCSECTVLLCNTDLDLENVIPLVLGISALTLAVS